MAKTKKQSQTKDKKTNKSKTTAKSKRMNLIIFLAIGIILLCIVVVLIYISVSTQQNATEIMVNDNQIEDFTIDDLKFETETDDNQINIFVTNTSQEDLDIQSFIIKVTDTEGNVDRIALDYNQVLTSNNQTTLSLGYQTENIDKISFQVKYNQ